MEYEQARSAAEVVGLPRVADPVGADRILQLRAWLETEAVGATEDWSDRPGVPLRVTKGRMRSLAICPAQVLAELEPFEYGPATALGVACDAAASLLTLHPGFRPSSTWWDALEPLLQVERPEMIEYVESIPAESQELLVTDLDERCGTLPELLGDLSTTRAVVHERIRVVLGAADVLLVGEPDMTLGAGGDVLIEVKSGSFSASAADEIRHYALLKSLRDLRVPAYGCVVSLRDERIVVFPIRFEELESGARRLVESIAALVDIDQRIAAGQAVPTRAGGHCRNCGLVRRCPDADPVASAEHADDPTEPDDEEIDP